MTASTTRLVHTPSTLSHPFAPFRTPCAVEVREEEYCYIPMGGALPDPEQRIVPFGGAANTVHPATGYQLCRMLCSSTDVAGALTAELRRPDFDPDAAAAAAHAALWPRASRLQRDFAVFGGEFLGSQPVALPPFDPET
jgi:hypothetical protein